MSLALGGDVADGLVFRLAVETNVTGGVERVVFLALRGEEGQAECVWPVPLDVPIEKACGDAGCAAACGAPVLVLVPTASPCTCWWTARA